MPAMVESSLRRSGESAWAVSLRSLGSTRGRVIEPEEPWSVVRTRATSGWALRRFSAFWISGAAAVTLVPVSVWIRTLRRL